MIGCGYVGVDKRWVKKNFVFGRNVLQIGIFWSSIVLTPYPLPKTHDRWVCREGYGGPELGEKSFQLSLLFIV
jgi:hypothetical protein